MQVPLKAPNNKHRTVILAIVLASLAAIGVTLRAQDAMSAVSGTVKSASGEPVQGAFVRIHNVDSGVTFLVVSGGQGRYESPKLLPGKYLVEAIGGEYQSDPSAAPVEIRGGQPAKDDLVLGAARKAGPPRKRLTQADFAAVMPEAPAKQVILTKCVSCHDLEGVDTRTLRSLGTKAEWGEVVDVHQRYTDGRPEHLSVDQVKSVVDYMTQNFSREGHPPRLPREKEDRSDPNRHMPRTLLQGTEAKYAVTEFSLRSEAFPHDISVDSQGIAWISEHSENKHGPDGMKPGIGMIGRIDPKTLSYTQIAPPPGKYPSRPSGSAVDPHGIVWHDDNGHNDRLISYNPKTMQFKTYDVPAPPRLKDLNDGGIGNGAANMNTIIFEDGFVWGSGLLSSEIYKLDPVSGGVISYPTPWGHAPYGIAFDNNKMLWYSAEFSDEIVKLDPATGKRTVYKVPTPHADLRHIQTDAEGNVWASAQESDKLIKVDGRTGEMIEYEPPTKLSGVDTVDVDRKHNLIWIGEDQMDKLARFDPKTKTFVEFSLPIAGTGVKRIYIDPSNPNRVWWCSTGTTPGSLSESAASRAGFVESSASTAGYVEVIEPKK